MWPQALQGWAGGEGRQDPASEAHGKVTEAGEFAAEYDLTPQPGGHSGKKARPGHGVGREEETCIWMELAQGRLRVLGSWRAASCLQESGLKQGEALGSDSPETPEPGPPLSGRAGATRARSPHPSQHLPGVSPHLRSLLG